MPDQFVMVVRRALMMEEGAWREIKDSAAFTPFAIGWAVIVVILGGLGAYLWGELLVEGDTPDGWFSDTIILGSLFTLLLLLAWMGVIYFVLGQMFGVSMTPDALLRVFAVAISPLALGLLMFIPEFNFLLGVSSLALTFCLLVFALESAFGVSHANAAVAAFAGFAVFAIILALLITADNAYANGFFVLEHIEDRFTHSY